MAENETRLIAPTDHERVIDLLLGVARLGEAGLRGWWQSHGLDQAVQYVLGGSLPRTWRCAALELAIASAKRRHEETLGRPTALHLFSDELPSAGLQVRGSPSRRPAAIPLGSTASQAGRLIRPSLRSDRGRAQARQGRSLLSPSSRPIYRCRARRSRHSRLDREAAYRRLPRPIRRLPCPVLRPRAMTVLTSNVQKGGALLDDTRRLVETWDPRLDAEDNLSRVANGIRYRLPTSPSCTLTPATSTSSPARNSHRRPAPAFSSRTTAGGYSPPSTTATTPTCSPGIPASPNPDPLPGSQARSIAHPYC